IGELQSALKLWEQAPVEPAFQRQRLCGIVKVHLLQALEAARMGLAKVAGAQQHADLSTEIELPGNTASLIGDTERDLRDLERGIEGLVPQRDRLVSAWKRQLDKRAASKKPE